MINKNKTKRRCNVCGDHGHHQYLCRRLKDDYGQYPIGKKDMETRNKLSKKLISIDPVAGGILLQRAFNDNRAVLKELPKKVKAMVIHKRYMIQRYIP